MSQQTIQELSAPQHPGRMIKDAMDIAKFNHDVEQYHKKTRKMQQTKKTILKNTLYNECLLTAQELIERKKKLYGGENYKN